MVHSPQVIDLHCLKLFKKPFVNISEHFLHFNEENNMAKSYKTNDDTSSPSNDIDITQLARSKIHR